MGGKEAVIRRVDMETGDSKELCGHKSWVMTMTEREGLLYSAGDDGKIIIWCTQKLVMLDMLHGHRNAISTLAFAEGCLFSGSYDHTVLQWDLEEIENKI